MQTQTETQYTAKNIDIDWYTVLKDVLKQWLSILMIALAAFFLTYSYMFTHYTESYTVSTTFTINTRSSYTDVYSNMSSASDTATEFSQLLNSSILQKKVAEVLGLDYMPGSVSAEVITDTNLMTLKVRESSPRMAYEVTSAVLENYNKVSGSLLGDVVLNILVQPQVPEAPDAAFSPLHRMIQAFFGAMFLMIFFLALTSIFRDTIRREKDVEKKLDTQLLGTLYHEKKFGFFAFKKKRVKSSILISNPTVSFRYSEAMKKLAVRIQNKMEHRNAKTVLVTSVMENEGKSTVAANIALALAEESKKVLLMDADFRKPALYKIFGVSPEEVEPFAQILNGQKEMKHLIHELKNPDMKLILNTVTYPDSVEMLSRGLLKQILEYLKQNMDYIIIDTAPMALVADTEELLEIVDSAVLVVRQHMTAARDINDAIDILNRRELKLLGCVFNDVSGEQFSLGHGYGGYAGFNGYNKYSSYGYGNYNAYGSHYNTDHTDTGKQSEGRENNGG